MIPLLMFVVLAVVFLAALGRNGLAFFERHYAWPVIVKKYLDMLQQLASEKPVSTMAALPGWLGRRRRTLPPADSIVKQLPAGPYKAKPAAAPSAAQRPAAPSHAAGHALSFIRTVTVGPGIAPGLLTPACSRPGARGLMRPQPPSPPVGNSTPP